MLDALFNPIAIVSLVLALMVLVVLYSVSKLIVHAAPDEVKVFTGSGKTSGEGAGTGNVTYLRGGRKLRIPLFHKVFSMSLSPHRLDIRLDDVLTMNNIPISIDAVALVGYGDSEEDVRTAVTRFLTYQHEETETAIGDVLVGQARGVIADMTAEDANTNREELSIKLKSAAAAEYKLMGLTIISFQIQSISDNEGMFEALGATRLAAVKATADKDRAESQRDADIAKANASKDSKVVEAEAAAVKAEAERDSAVRIALAKAETDQENARTNQAGPLADAEARQAVVEAEVEVERRKTLAEAELQVARKDQEEKRLEADIIVPAEAEKREIEINAEAERRKIEVEAEAKRTATIKAGEGDAEATKLRAEASQAEMEAIAAGDKAKRLAEAEGTEALKLAEALGQDKLADALLKMEDVGVRVQLAELLIPQLAGIVAAAAAPFGEIDNIMMIDNGGGEGGGGTLAKLGTSVPIALGTASSVLDQFGLGGLLNFAKTDDSSEESIPPTVMAMFDKLAAENPELVQDLLSRYTADDAADVDTDNSEVE